MAKVSEFVDLFRKSLVDYLRLGSVQFWRARRAGQAQYLSALEFQSASFVLAFGLLLVEFYLVGVVLAEVNAGVPAVAPAVQAGKFLVFQVAVLAANAVFVAVVSGLWPVRSPVSVRAAFELASYPQAIALLIMIPFDVIVMPILTSLVHREVVPRWLLGVPLAVGILVGMVIYFSYTLPSVSDLANVSSKRMFWGQVFWSFVLSVLLGIGAVVLLGGRRF